MDISPRPNILWRLFVILGVGTMAATTVSDEAWEQFDDVAGGAVPRDAIRNLLFGTVGLHTLESLFACRSAKKHDIDHPLRWGFSTFLWGFPVLLRLRKAKKARRALA